MQRQIMSRRPEPARIDLKVDVRDFGPIANGSIHIKPLTIFIGPNNSGKSYAAMLVHSILSSSKLRRYGWRGLESGNIFGDLLDIITKNAEASKTGKFNVPSGIVQRVAALLVQEYGRNLEAVTCRNFGMSRPNELVRAGSRSARISVSGGSKFSVTLAKKFNFKMAQHPNSKYTIDTSADKTSRHLVGVDERNGRTIIKANGLDNPVWLEATNTILKHTYGQITPHAERLDSFYLPASRSGMLQGHKALSAAIVEHASFGGIESLEIPRLTGAAADFISRIITARNHPGPYYELANNMESELLEGTIRLSSQKETLSEIAYKTGEIEIPLSRASSTITEIAPLSLYLKHIIPRHSLLIIEEPEAHLHPQNQILMARYIVKMIREGLNILITTHSSYLLERLGQFVLADRISPMTQRNEVFGESNYLNRDEVATHIFLKKASSGHAIEQLATDDEVGIIQDEFIKSTDWLYDKYVKIQQGMQSD